MLVPVLAPGPYLAIQLVICLQCAVGESRLSISLPG